MHDSLQVIAVVAKINPSSLRRQGPSFIFKLVKRKRGPCLRKDDGIGLGLNGDNPPL